MTAPDAARSPAERRLAEARQSVGAWLQWNLTPGNLRVRDAALEELIAAAREAERDRLLAGQYDADVDPGR